MKLTGDDWGREYQPICNWRQGAIKGNSRKLNDWPMLEMAASYWSKVKISPRGPHATNLFNYMDIVCGMWACTGLVWASQVLKLCITLALVLGVWLIGQMEPRPTSSSRAVSDFYSAVLLTEYISVSVINRILHVWKSKMCCFCKEFGKVTVDLRKLGKAVPDTHIHAPTLKWIWLILLVHVLVILKAFVTQYENTQYETLAGWWIPLSPESSLYFKLCLHNSCSQQWHVNNVIWNALKLHYDYKTASD